MFRAALLRRAPLLLTVSGVAQQLVMRRSAARMDQSDSDELESEEERQHWQERKAVCGFCAFFLDSPCARTFKPWSRCVDNAKKGDNVTTHSFITISRLNHTEQYLIEEKDFIEVCSAYTDALFKCQSDNKEYFEAFQRALTDTDAGAGAGTDTDAEEDTDADTEVPNSDSNGQQIVQDKNMDMGKDMDMDKRDSLDFLPNGVSLSSTVSSSEGQPTINSTTGTGTGTDTGANISVDSVCRLQETEEEKQHWESKKADCGFCAFCLDSPCAEYFKPWSRCIDKTEDGNIQLILHINSLKQYALLIFITGFKLSSFVDESDATEHCREPMMEFILCASRNKEYFEAEEATKPLQPSDEILIPLPTKSNTAE